MCEGDLIIQFGNLHADVFNKLDQLKEVVNNSKNVRNLILKRGIGTEKFIWALYLQNKNYFPSKGLEPPTPWMLN